MRKVAGKTDKAKPKTLNNICFSYEFHMFFIWKIEIEMKIKIKMKEEIKMQIEISTILDNGKTTNKGGKNNVLCSTLL